LDAHDTVVLVTPQSTLKKNKHWNKTLKTTGFNHHRTEASNKVKKIANVQKNQTI